MIENSLQETAGRHARRGAFSAGLTALAVAAVLVFNLLAHSCRQWAQIDLTGSGSTTSATSQDYLAGLEDDVRSTCSPTRTH
ncbi:MAG: hypothetical protein ACLSUM_03705 [Dysosmobacter welbionis]